MKKEEDDLFPDEEEKPSGKIMVISGIVLVIGAAVICFFIWQLTHKNQDQVVSNGGESTVSTQEQSQSSDPAQGESGSNGTSQPEEEKNESQSLEGDSTSKVPEESSPSSGAAQSSQSQPGQTAGQEPNKDKTDGGQGSSESDGSTIEFQEVKESVTAKDKTNLRSEPSTDKPETVVVQLKNGETATRTGINTEKGWSRLDYNGQTLYAVSQYLTTDLAPKASPTPIPAPKTDGNTVTTQDGRSVTFTPCDDTVSPKNAVNLRTEPSTSQGNATVSCKLEYKQNVRRTGINEDSGWSRVEYNGEVLYVITSYIYVIEPEAE